EDSYVPNIVIAPSVIPGTIASTAVNHYGALRAVEEMLGLPLLGNAATATSLRGVCGCARTRTDGRLRPTMKGPCIPQGPCVHETLMVAVAVGARARRQPG